MSLAPISVAEALGQPAAWDALIDVRSPSEFADDHLPGAVNWPVLDDAERARVGTIYTQVSTFEARKVGAALVSRRIADMLEQHMADKPRDWRPLVYCWRGGQRSGSLGLVLAQVGFRTRQLSGGYKAFRGQVIQDLATLPGRHRWQVLRGRTGSGKTRLLAALAEAGAQVLDLEDLAAHRGSVLGGLPTRPQPSQRHFETLLWQRLRALDPTRPVFVEGESRRIGERQLPDAMLGALQHPACTLHVDTPMEARVALLLEDYAYFTTEAERLCERLGLLTELRGKACVARWQAMARRGDWATLLPELMTQHYDPLYDKSMLRSREGPQDTLVLRGTDAAALAEAAHALVQRPGTASPQA